jgi:NAD(P)-dependent dehydrogenase (short-subunit alcohol dehydrogenase family)
MGKLDGKIALITGAGSGMGQATALLFAKEGAKVGVIDYVPAGGQETVRMIREAGGKAIFIEADISKAADAERMIRTTVDTYGRIDILHNNAGISQRMVPMAEITEDEWNHIIDVNLKGVFLSSKYAIPVMLKQGGGVIINTASCAGIVGWAGLSAYSASKGGGILLTKTMALDYAGQNIRVNCICPGFIRTPMAERQLPKDPQAQQAVIMRIQPPMGRIGQPQEIAQAALYLASDDSSFVTGAVLVVDGGLIAGAVRM